MTPKLTPEEVEEAKRLRASGLTLTEIAARYEVAVSSIYRRIPVHDRPRTPRPPRLSPEEVEIMKSMRREGVSVGDIAAKLHVSPDSVWRWTTRAESIEPAPTKDECLLSAYPCAWRLPVEERERFADELADTSKWRRRDDQIDALVKAWKKKAATA